MSQGETGAAITVAAPAKITLYLHLLRRQADAYHLIDGLIVFAALADRLVLRPASGLSLAVDGRFAGALDAEPDNLVLRAARALAPARGAAITLTKRLPVAAGLGGGSSDAAAALIGLNQLWGLDRSAGDLARIGATLGADVPACLFGQPCFVSGIGEVIEPAPSPPAAGLVLVNPGVALSTAAVYRAWRPPFSAAARFANMPADAAALAELLAVRRNDLAAVAAALVPEIGAVLRALAADADCLLARLCGSGATCFGLFPPGDHAAAAAERLRQAHPDWWVADTVLATGGEG